MRYNIFKILNYYSNHSINCSNEEKFFYAKLMQLQIKGYHLEKFDENLNDEIEEELKKFEQCPEVYSPERYWNYVYWQQTARYQRACQQYLLHNPTCQQREKAQVERFLLKKYFILQHEIDLRAKQGQLAHV